MGNFGIWTPLSEFQCLSRGTDGFFKADVAKPDSIYYDLTAKYLARRVVL